MIEGKSMQDQRSTGKKTFKSKVGLGIQLKSNQQYSFLGSLTFSVSIIDER